MNKNNPYGYKVGYCESGSRLFIKHFMTYTYNQALSARRFYRKAPQRTRDTNRPIIDPFWEIKPITKKEYLAGIWNESPFLYKKRHRAGDVQKHFFSAEFDYFANSSKAFLSYFNKNVYFIFQIMPFIFLYRRAYGSIAAPQKQRVGKNFAPFELYVLQKFLPPFPLLLRGLRLLYLYVYSAMLLGPCR